MDTELLPKQFPKTEPTQRERLLAARARAQVAVLAINEALAADEPGLRDGRISLAFENLQRAADELARA